MFETALLENPSSRSTVLSGHHRVVTMLAATILEITALGALLVFPLVHTQALDLKNLQERVAAPPAPRSVKIITVVHERGGGADPQTIGGTRIFAPKEIPNQVPVLIDPPMGPATSKGPIDGLPTLNGCLDCVIGSTNYEESAFRPPTPPPPLKPRPVERTFVISDIQAAKLIYGPKPEYPPMAKMAHIQGQVRLAAIIGADGRVQILQVLHGHPLLVNASMEAVSQWRYQPTLLNGEPVEVQTEIVVNFILGE